MTRAGWPRPPTSASSASRTGSTGPPRARRATSPSSGGRSAAISVSTGRMPAASASSTMSSPSARNCPSARRWRRAWSLRACFSRALPWEVIGSTAGSPSCGKRGLGCLGERSERLRVGDREVREHLAVELDLGLAQSVHELVVGEPVLAGAGVDADDPEPAEVALARAAVAIGVGERLQHLLLRLAVGVLLDAAIALRGLEHLAAFLLGVDAEFHACHRRAPIAFPGGAAPRFDPPGPSPWPGASPAAASRSCARAGGCGTRAAAAPCPRSSRGTASS